MYELKLSKLFRKQIKLVAIKSQPVFLDICESWDEVHIIINDLGERGNPFQAVRFAEKVNGRNFYLVYRLIENKKKLWVEAIVKKQSKDKFIIHNP